MAERTDRERLEALGIDAALDHATPKKSRRRNVVAPDHAEIRVRLEIAAEQLREVQRLLRTGGDPSSAGVVAEVASALEGFREQLKPEAL